MEVPNRHIHFIHFSSNPGGIEVLIPYTVKNMPQFTFRAFVIRPPGKHNIYDDIDIPVCYGISNKLKVLFQFFLYAHKYRKDIFHVFNIGPIFLFLLKLASSKKVVYGIHGTKYWKNRWQRIYLKMFWKMALSNRQKFTSNSFFSARMFKERVNSKTEISLLYNPIDCKVFYNKSEKLRVVDKPFTIMYSGRLTNGKNLYTWLDIAAALSKRKEDVHFELYGSGPIKEQLEVYATQKGINSKVEFKGHVKNIANAYQNTDLLIFLSEYESFGNVVVESILCGTPVIASNIPSMQEIFQNYPEFLVELDENLEQNVLKKIEEIEHLKSLVPKARDEFMNRFSLEQHIQKLEQIYNSFDNNHSINQS